MRRSEHIKEMVFMEMLVSVKNVESLLYLSMRNFPVLMLGEGGVRRSIPTGKFNDERDDLPFR